MPETRLLLRARFLRKKYPCKEGTIIDSLVSMDYNVGTL